MKALSPAFAQRAAGAAVLLTALHCTARLFFGVDFFDEAYWVAFQWRFALGDVPYVDEHSFHQNFAVFLFPFVWLFRLVHPKPDGLVLFTRGVFLLGSLGAAAFTYRFFRKRTSSEIALLFSAIFLLIPLSKPGFSYASLGMYGVYLGALCLFELAERPSRWLAAGAGLLHAVGMASDPSQIPTVLCLVAAAAVFSFDRKPLFFFYVPAGLGTGLAMLGFAGPRGLESLWESSRYLCHSDFSVHFFTHVKDLLGFPYRPIWLGAFLVGCALVWRRRPRELAAVAMALPIASLLVVRSLGYGTGFFFTYFGLSGFLVYFAQPKDTQIRRFFWSLWVPSLVASISYTWAGNLGGITRFGNGMLMAVVATCYFQWRFMPRVFPRLVSLPLWITLACLASLEPRQSPYAGDVRFTHGPFAGIATEKPKLDWFNGLREEVIRREKPGKRIAFHAHFPAGYLLTSMRPATGNVWWTFPIDAEAADAFLRDYRRYEPNVGLAVVVHQLYYNPQEINPYVPSALDRLGPEIERSMRKTFSDERFTIYEGAQ